VADEPIGSGDRRYRGSTDRWIMADEDGIWYVFGARLCCELVCRIVVLTGELIWSSVVLICLRE